MWHCWHAFSFSRLSIQFQNHSLIQQFFSFTIYEAHIANSVPVIRLLKEETKKNIYNFQCLY